MLTVLFDYCKNEPHWSKNQYGWCPVEPKPLVSRLNMSCDLNHQSPSILAKNRFFMMLTRCQEEYNDRNDHQGQSNAIRKSQLLGHTDARRLRQQKGGDHGRKQS